MATAPADATDVKRTPEEMERYWFENVYAGDRMRQLTVRALIMGMFLGAIMCFSNLYVGLRAGWGLGVSITSSILAFAMFQTLHKLFPKQFPEFSILENNALASCASAAGYMTGSGMVNAIPALMLLQPDAVPAKWIIMVWIGVISLLGVFLAVPAKRQMINIEQLRFPTGIAAATTLRTLHNEGGGAAARQASSLLWACAAGAVLTWFRDANAKWMTVVEWGRGFGWTKLWGTWFGYPHVPSTWLPFDMKIGKYRMMQDLTLSFEGSLLFIAAGAIMGMRQAWSLMLGTVINYGILAPMMLAAGVIPETGGGAFRRISTWSLWIGVPMMVTSGLLLFFVQWRTVLRAFSTITAMFRPKSAVEDPMDKIEVPGSWFIGGVLVLGTIVVLFGHHHFHIQYWMGTIAVLMTFLLVVVAGRATGETDITPTGPLSKITQLTFGALAPGNITINLMTANITAGACSHAGDLLTDLKSGYLLGAKPRQQFIAQFFGVLIGTAVVVPMFYILIRNDYSNIGSDQWPAPAAQVWRGVAELLAKGVSALHPTARIGLVVGALSGIVLALLELAFPKHKKFIPSATGLGLAFTITGFYSVSMFIGALLAVAFTRFNKKMADEYVVPVSSGIIAGESLMGVGVAVLVALKFLEP